MRKERTYPRRGLHGEVVHTIGLAIVRGELRPGSLLPNEERLSGDLDVSRTVMREAVKVLAAKGLVEARPKTGTRVRTRYEWNLLDPDVLAWRVEAGLDDDFLADVFALRRLIEPAASADAARSATPEALAELERWVTEMTEAGEDGDAYVAADVRFHTAIYRACKNEVLAHVGETLRGVYRESFTITLKTRTVTLPMHRDVYDAIAAHDPVAAQRATERLLAATAETHLRELQAIARQGDGDGRRAEVPS